MNYNPTDKEIDFVSKRLAEFNDKAPFCTMLLVSTQVDEEAQHFYRKLGYKDCGGFTIVLFSDDLIEIAKEMYGEFYGN